MKKKGLLHGTLSLEQQYERISVSLDLAETVKEAKYVQVGRYNWYNYNDQLVFCLNHCIGVAVSILYYFTLTDTMHMDIVMSHMLSIFQ